MSQCGHLARVGVPHVWWNPLVGAECCRDVECNICTGEILLLGFVPQPNLHLKGRGNYQLSIINYQFLLGFVPQPNLHLLQLFPIPYSLFPII